MNSDKALSVATIAVALELGRKTIRKLEETNRMSTADPDTSVSMAEAILTKQLADAILLKLKVSV